MLSIGSYYFLLKVLSWLKFTIEYNRNQWLAWSSQPWSSIFISTGFGRDWGKLITAGKAILDRWKLDFPLFYFLLSDVAISNWSYSCRVGPVISPGAHLKFNVSFDPRSKIWKCDRAECNHCYCIVWILQADGEWNNRGEKLHGLTKMYGNLYSFCSYLS